MKIKIPKENRDLRAAVRNRILRQSFLCFFWTLAVFLLAWFTHTIDSPLALLLYIAVCLFPFVKCKIWRWFFDRPFEGEIIKREEKQRVESKRPFHVTRESLIRVFDQQLVIRQKNGKLKIHTVSRRNDELVPNYREGDFVRHYYGTKYIQTVTDRTDAPCICVMCGTQNDLENKVCGVCGMSLIDHRM